MVVLQVVQQQLDRRALSLRWLSDGFIGQRAVAGEIDNSAVVKLLVIRQKLGPLGVPEKAGRLLIKIAQQGEVISLNFTVGNRLLDGLQQVQVVRKALV